MPEGPQPNTLDHGLFFKIIHSILLEQHQRFIAPEEAITAKPRGTPPSPPQALAVLPLEKVVVLPIIFTKKRRFDAAEKNEKPKAQNDNETEKQAAKRKRDAVSTATYKNSLGQSGIAKPSRVYLNTPHSDIDIEIEL